MIMMLIEAFSGLGIFLFGMTYMELALKEVAGIRLKHWIKNSTSTPMKAILTGAGATAALQSSSIVTLMTLSFVSASLISLTSGIGVIFGSNLGTTVTAWIVATLGFKVKMELFVLPLMGVGGFALILGSSRKKVVAIAKAMIGFGLLFFGLDLMKSSIEMAAVSIDLSLYTSFPLLVFVILGLVITSLIQSSSAATAIILSALYAQILGFDQAASMVIGTNIGTTTTAILGSIGGIPDKKRAAVAHLIFNLFTALIAFMLLPFTTEILMNGLDLKDNPTIALAIFHTFFNFLGVVLLSPFIPFIAKYLGRIFSHKQKMPTKYIHKVDSHLPDTAFVALRDEISRLFVKTMKFSLLISNIKPSDIFKNNRNAKEAVEANPERIEFDYQGAYEKIKEIELSAIVFANELSQENLSTEQSHSLDTILVSIRESVYAAKILKDTRANMDEFYESDNPDIVQLYNDIRQNLAYAMIIFVNYMLEIWTMEKCREKFEKAEEGNNKILKEASSIMSKNKTNKTMLVSLLNTNRSVYIAITSLFAASKGVRLHFLLEKDEKNTK